jgi:L-ribulose-5-phosphate 3-epimerase
MSLEYFEKFPTDGLYVMQGRLSPPDEGKFQSFPCHTWHDEIRRVSLANLRGIEWIYDVNGLGVNPIETKAGRMLLRGILREHDVDVRSMCADYFMDRPFHKGNVDERQASLDKLAELIMACVELDVRRIVLPFVDSSRMDDAVQMAAVVSSLNKITPIAREFNIELHIESDLPPDEFSAFLRELPDDCIKVNYDAGNSASLGYKPIDEFSAYGDRIGSFHVKDRKLNAGTVPLGQGSADFRSLRSCLESINYSGDFVLQIARGMDGVEVDWLRRNSNAVVRWIRGEIESPVLEL